MSHGSGSKRFDRMLHAFRHLICARQASGGVSSKTVRITVPNVQGRVSRVRKERLRAKNPYSSENATKLTGDNCQIVTRCMNLHRATGDHSSCACVTGIASEPASVAAVDVPRLGLSLVLRRCCLPRANLTAVFIPSFIHPSSMCDDVSRNHRRLHQVHVKISHTPPR